MSTRGGRRGKLVQGGGELWLDVLGNKMRLDGAVLIMEGAQRRSTQALWSFRHTVTPTVRQHTEESFNAQINARAFMTSITDNHSHKHIPITSGQRVEWGYMEVYGWKKLISLMFTLRKCNQVFFFGRRKYLGTVCKRKRIAIFLSANKNK